MIRKNIFIAAALLLIASSIQSPVMAQGFPSKPIKFIVPYAAGGLPDTVARLVAQKLQEPLGQSVIVENRPGGNGAVAATALKLSPADGYTLLVTDGSMLTINPLLYKKLGYDPTMDFAPVSLVAQSPLFLAVHPNVNANTLDELIALAKSKPGKMNYGSSGIGSSHHLTAEAMIAGFDVAITHIPYKGSSASVPALIAGDVDFVFSAYPSLAGFVKSGQARLLGTNSAKRSALAPDVPAIAEKLPGFEFAVLVGVLAPTGTPNDIVQRVSAEIAALVKRPEVMKQLQAAGIEGIGGSATEFANALKAESVRVGVAVKRANLKAE